MGAINSYTTVQAANPVLATNPAVGAGAGSNPVITSTASPEQTLTSEQASTNPVTEPDTKTMLNATVKKWYDNWMVWVVAGALVIGGAYFFTKSLKK